MTSSRLGARVAAASLSIVALAAVAGCSPASVPETSRSLTLPVGALWAGWDPAQGAVAWALQHQAVFDTLVAWDPETNSSEPWLATEVTLSEDKRLVEITLRDDVDFVDGTHLDAAGVEKYLDHLLASESFIRAGYVVPYGPEVTATGEYTLEITTETPIFFPEFEQNFLGGTPILSPAAVDDPEKAMAEPLGSGPYLVDEIVPDSEISYVRNPDYWNPDAFPFDEITLTVIVDATATLNALISGQVDAAPLPVDQVGEAEEAGLALHEGAGSFYTVLVQDPANSPIAALRDVRVRTAIALSFDREAIRENLDFGYGNISSQAFFAGQPEHIEGGDERYGYDLDRARELMAEAGYAEGFDVVVPTTPELAGAERFKPIVQQSLADIGIRVTYETFPDQASWVKAAFGGTYPLTLTEMFTSATFGLLTQEVPGYGRLIVPTPEVEELVATIKTAPADESAAASQELGELVLEELLYIPFAQPAKFWGSAPDVAVHVDAVVGDPSLRDFTPAP